MLAVSECPPANRLQKLALGLLDEADAESLSSHVLECNRCGVTLAEFQGSDTLADALHQAARTTESIPHGPVVDRAMEQACQLVGSQPRGSEETTSGVSLDTNAPGAGSGKKPATLDELDFGDLLSPPQVEGEIGRLGPYRVLKVLGAGGMGMVFLAEDVQLERRVALKAMKPGL